MGSNQRKVEICYLCGRELDHDRANNSRDHVPPRQFYAEAIRKQHNLNLFTLPVHVECNQSYKDDEEYFLVSMGPMAGDKPAGKALYPDLWKKFNRSQGRRLGEMVRKEWEQRPSGLFLPGNKVAKKFDIKRVRRVAWKIVRGLYFKEKGDFLPEKAPNDFFIIYPEDLHLGSDKKPAHISAFEQVRNEESRGKHKDVIDYKYKYWQEIHNWSFWAMHFWSKLIMMMAFEHPLCPCDKCMALRSHDSK